MAKSKNQDPGYTTDLHIRLKTDEREQLQKKADEYGVTLSQAARRIIFRRLDGSEDSSDEMSPKEAHFRTLQGVQSLKTMFKKVNIDIGRFVTAYEKSLTTKNTNGDPSVNTEQTVRSVTALVNKQLQLQDGLNEIIRCVGGAEIHFAAKPATGTVVGDHMAKEAAGISTQTEQVNAPAKQIEKTSRIPEYFRHMFNVTLDNCTLIKNVETYKDGNYEKIRLQVRTEIYRNRQAQSYTLDAVDFASRYKNLMSHLVEGAKVTINGELDFIANSYNGQQSQNAGTVEIKSFSLANACMFNSTFEGELVKDVEQFKDGSYEKIRLCVKTEIYRDKKLHPYIIDAVDFASRYRNVIPHLTAGVKVIVNGGFDYTVGTYNGVLSDSKATVDIKTLTIPEL